MKTDKSTIDLLFRQRGCFEKAIEDHKKKLKDLDTAKTEFDLKLYSVASEYILDALTESNIKEKYGRDTPFMTYEEIKKEVMEREPRFTKQDIMNGLDILVLETNSKIEKRTKPHKTAGYREVTIFTYLLKENA